MNNDGSLLIKVFIGFFVGVCFLFCWEILSFSKNIGTIPDRATMILKRIEQLEHPDLGKAETSLKVVMISGVRG